MNQLCYFTRGDTFRNSNGTSYEVLTSTLFGHTTVRSMTRTPWVCTAVNIRQDGPDTYSWDYSKDGHFDDPRPLPGEEVLRG